MEIFEKVYMEGILQMDEVLNSFINAHREEFDEYFSNYIHKKIYNRKDYKGIRDKINEIYNKYPKIREFIEDEIPTSFNQEDTDAYCEIFSLYTELHTIELLETFKLGGKEVYIFFKEQDMLIEKNII